MRIGTLIDTRGSVSDICDRVRRYREQGYLSGWANQIFGYDALGLVSVIGAQVPDIELGTAVIPVYNRHPLVMAQQALTAQAASGGRLTLGIGLSHQAVVEQMWGLSFDRPVRYMREYLSALGPMLSGETVNFAGEVITARNPGPLSVGDATPPSVLLAALGPEMLRLAGEMADGTVTWMVGVKTVAEHTVPLLSAAASSAGRPAPRVVVALPVSVTADPERVRGQIDQVLAVYPTLPSYRAMLDREGAAGPSGVAIVGDEAHVTEALSRLAGEGATDFIASAMGNREERARTDELLGSLSS